MEVNKYIESIFNPMSEGILIVDKDSLVLFANEAYLKFIGKKKEEIIQQKITDFRPGSRLPEVVATGERILHAARTENSNEKVYFVNMYPIYNEETVVGGISVVTFLDDAYDVKKALENHEMYIKDVLARINELHGKQEGFDTIIAKSPKSVEVKELAKKMAVTEATVLLESESGTGKEVYAKAIHNASPRSKETFLAVNCASFNSTLLESELFGYVGGSFTGAEKKGKMGVFEAANGGTLFLDEISEIDLEFQAKLLRVLQERCIRPVGGLEEIPVDVRIICACNANLQEAVAEGKFRKDLYYRLNAFTLHIPPLRERRADIPALTEYFLKEFSEKLKKSIRITDEAFNCLMLHDWPGNVRELRNILEFGSYLSEDGIITLSMLPSDIAECGQKIVDVTPSTLAEKVRAFEKKEIDKLLTIYGDNLEGKKRVASTLGISLASLYNKMK